MKIDLGGTPIWVSPRRAGGAEIIQGRSRIKLRANEMAALSRALDQMSNDAQQGKEMATIETHIR